MNAVGGKIGLMAGAFPHNPNPARNTNDPAAFFMPAILRAIMNMWITM
jgi:hypothetical protein